MVYLPPASREQVSIIEALESGYNVVVDSVAGSGKTTTNLHVASRFKDDCNILLLTFNKKIKIETREKVRLLNLSNMEIHSYHSFCVKYYNSKCFTDYGIIDVLESDASTVVKPIPKYDIVIIDEAQDVCPLYYRLICKILKVCNEARLCILGDKNQSIYGFKDSDERYIIYADKLFGFCNSYGWRFIKLSETFRNPRQITDFVNECLLRECRLISNKDNGGIKVKYVICDAYNDWRSIHDDIIGYLKNGYSNDDIFVLSPSLKSSTSPLKKLANKLSMEGIPIYVPISDDENIDEEILKNKVVFSTYHQVKGLERKIVIVYGFDSGYMMRVAATANRCPNEIYVATTRSLERMTVIHHYKNDYLPFMDLSKLRKNVEFVETKQLSPKIVQDVPTEKAPREITVNELLRHIPPYVIKKCMEHITVDECTRVCSNLSEVLDIPVKTKQTINESVLYENVSDITGIAIPAYYQYRRTRKLNINLLPNIDMDKLMVRDLLHISNRWNSYVTGYNYKMHQIQRYNWLSKDILLKCEKRLDTYIRSDNLKFMTRKTVLVKGNNEEAKCDDMLLSCYIDCIEVLDNKDEIVWQIMLTKSIENEHILKFALIMYMIQYQNPSTQFKIVNVYDGSVYTISCSLEKLRNIFTDLIRYKYGSKRNEMDDETFLACNIIQ